jgi:FdhD protein
MDERPTSKTAVRVVRLRDGETSHPRRDMVATEEPMEIRLVASGETRRLAVTMRTPGSDFELAAGFLYSEGVITSRAAIRTISYCVDAEIDEAQQYNVVNVALARMPDDLRGLDRHFVINSACGVCGKDSIDAVYGRCAPIPPPERTISPNLITTLAPKLREAQRLFEATGGLHAAALFDFEGTLLALREDVGRHNAMDKLIGWALMNDKLPLHDCVVLVSGRASFELVQKAATGGIPILCAISAPSSLAVSIARRMNMTLIGFLRDAQFNLYCGEERLVAAVETHPR